MQLRSGLRLQSVACDTQVMVVKAPGDDVDLRCGGHPLAPMGQAGEPEPITGGHDEGTQMGKRYGGDDSGLEVLCTKPGKGSLSIGDEPLPLKEAKALPSSD